MCLLKSISTLTHLNFSFNLKIYLLNLQLFDNKEKKTDC